MPESKSGKKKVARVLKAGYTKKTKNGRSYYVNLKTGHRVLKSTATRAAHKRRAAHRKRRVARK